MFTIEDNFTSLCEQIHEAMASKDSIQRSPEYAWFDDWYIHKNFASEE